MIVCPLCEHQQAQGTECDGCGKVLVSGGAAKVEVSPLPELELSRVRAGPDLPAVRLPDLEATGAPGVGPVPVQPLPELEAGRAPADGTRTAAPVGPVTCRYCRNVQAEGAVCERCGMRLPKLAAPVEARGPAPKGEAVWTRCRKCGAPAKGGERCGDCGHPVPMPEE